MGHYSDDFERADENPISDGGKWSSVQDLSDVRSYQTGGYAMPAAGYTNCGMRRNTGDYTSDQYSQVEKRNPGAGNGDFLGINCRVSDNGQNYYLGWLNTGGAGTSQLYSHVGAYNFVGIGGQWDAGPSLTTGDLTKMVCTGTNIDMQLNGTSTISGGRSNNVVSGGRPGIAPYGGATAGCQSSKWWGGDGTGPAAAACVPVFLSQYRQRRN